MTPLIHFVATRALQRVARRPYGEIGGRSHFFGARLAANASADGLDLSEFAELHRTKAVNHSSLPDDARGRLPGVTALRHRCQMAAALWALCESRTCAARSTECRLAPRRMRMGHNSAGVADTRSKICGGDRRPRRHG